MIRQLQPRHAGVAKRQVKAPKIYCRDIGLLRSLLVIEDFHVLFGQPAIGAVWEGFAIEQVLSYFRLAKAYFVSAYSGAEVDLFFSYKGRRYGFDYPGKVQYKIHEKISVLPLCEILRAY
jgi:predicted AAA+ superfamily ATPase